MIARLRAALPALHHRDFALLFSGQAISVVGDALFPVALAFAVLELSGSASSLGLVLAAQALPLAAFALVGGVVGDRVSRQKLMLASDLARAAIQALAATLLIAGAAEIWHLAVLAALYGAAEAFFRPAAGGLIPRLVPDERPAAGQLADRDVAERRDGARPGDRGRADRAVRPGQRDRHRRRQLPRQRRLPVADDARGPARARTTGETGAAFLAQLREGWREVTSRVWLRSFLGVLGAYHLIALPCVLALGADRRRPRARRRVELGGDRDDVRDRLDRRRGDRPARRARGARWWRASLAFLGAACQPAIIAGGGQHAADRRVRAAGRASASPSASRCGRRRSAARSRRASLSRVTSFDWFTSVGLMPLGYALVGPLADAIGLDADDVRAPRRSSPRSRWPRCCCGTSAPSRVGTPERSRTPASPM